MEGQSKKWLALIGTGISSMVVAVDFTIVNTVMSEIQKALSASVGSLQWVMAAYGIPFAVLLSIAGRLGDLYGRRLVLYIGMGGFLLASIGAGLSQNIWVLVFFRFLQGLFGSTVFPCGTAIASDAFPKKMQARAVSIYYAMLGLGLAIGPILGGIIVSFANWEWIFLINIPIILLSFAISLPSVRESKILEKIQLDWWGVAFFILGLGLLVFAITEAPTFGISSPLIYAAFIFAMIFLAAFLRIEKGSRSPVLPLYLFSNRGFYLGVMNVVASISCAWVVIFLLPLYLQNVLDYSPGISGLILLSMTLMTFFLPPISGSIMDKKGPFFLILLLFLSVIISYVLNLFFTTERQLWLILSSFVLFGIGWGIGNGIGPPLVLSHLTSSEDAGFVTGTLATIVNVSAVIFLSVCGAVFRFFEKQFLSFKLQSENIKLDPSQTELVRTLLSSPEQAKTLLNKFGHGGEKVLSLFHQSFIFGFRMANIALLLIACILFFSIIKPLLKEKRKIKKISQ
ncbi:MAG: MFS transporter [Simkaniaceae bacterium]